MLRKKIDDAKKELAKIEETRSELVKREQELEQSIQEASTEEEQKVVEEAVEEFEKEKADVEDKKEAIEKSIADLEEELGKEEEAQEDAPIEEAKEEEKEERKENKKMETRTFFGLTSQERDMFFQREDVKDYLGEVRSAIKEKRALTNVGLTVPEVFLGLIRENLIDYSKLYKHVYVRQINGDGRVVVMGTIPEAVWTDCCANLNELDLVFNDAEFGCWKVGGYFAVCNANLEDSDFDLASELITALGKAIGLAVDKAILYGTGNRMPLGIVTRLAQTAEPSDYPATARQWVDLHTSNIKTIASTVTGVDLFKEIAQDFGNAKGKYSRGSKVWVMNEQTYTNVVANAMSIDAGGAIVAGVNGTMPVISGVIEVLDFIPNDTIIAGYFDLYTLVERAGAKFVSSEHVRFLQDQTVFKGTARYDGQPVIAEGFVAIGLNGTTPSANMTFAPDTANEAESA